MLNFSQLKDKIIIISGPTASGKSALAIDIAREVDGVIINSDAMQVYKELPILTAQPDLSDQLHSPHRLYSIIEMDTHYSVAIWLDWVKREITSCKEKRRAPVIVGGSGLYIKSLVDGLAFIPGISESTRRKMAEMISSSDSVSLHKRLFAYDPDLARRLAPSDLKRITRGLAVYLETRIALSKWQSDTKPYLPRDEFFIINVDIERESLYRNCNTRFVAMLKMGAVDEVETLLNQKPGIKYPKILGLYELINWLEGKTTKEEAIEKAQQFTRNYAKRQTTWFRNQMRYDFFLRKGGRYEQ
ncbi:MAG: tRNA (adenosine(37)-N6)-dimethylallyltransferase MiaA [Candidatus Midichloria mitochondrii]|nr:tRNA (adenosine(37)-N6)-dimethylallyltransferase MiaA [Candidatus Midichloria mitochondrii]MDJ1256372.1 tRNA (adenosine(37)-N6)-dimethylallyltransferase MiaA [Candidatus Midichloria mitochondrii]MDJ1288037.1 tRNA (adenosine(37)-N6)-dimethylallyltransferase MiaA [Candidatus Midichloria mitochondrii]MDJ1298927.1 tRNA (adenosine(37)-N6)-dimethylallyltransferase MiaA [Candidatus Midichloria mitochondrii]MDJ1313090.1 tRNA (adenosine(37)-N6)-dimethylallyltransferase MiaA [Candidatus Midichloria mi